MHGFMEPRASVRHDDTIYQGDSGSAARFFYCSKASRSERERGLGGVKAIHPTVKPLALMEYLIKLVTMPRPKLLLDPFMGSGSTIVAAARLGRAAIGIEIDPKYFDIAVRRVKAEVAQGTFAFAEATAK